MLIRILLLMLILILILILMLILILIATHLLPSSVLQPPTDGPATGDSVWWALGSGGSRIETGPLARLIRLHTRGAWSGNYAGWWIGELMQQTGETRSILLTYCRLRKT